MAEDVLSTVRLADITVSHNPRSPLRELKRNLETEGLDPNWSVVDLVQNLAFSDEQEKRDQFVSLIEKYESGPKQLLELAASRRECQIAPIVIQKNGSTYGIVVGERRFAAAAYNHIKFGTPAEINSVIKNLTSREARRIAFDENNQHLPMTPLEEGEWYHSERKVRLEELKAEAEKNGEKPPRYSLQNLADDLVVEYQHLRGREALTYLPDDLKRKLENGKLNLTDAINAGLKLKSGKKTEEPKDKEPNRRRVRTLKQVETLYDESRETKSEDYLSALADVMSITLSKATKESDSRIKAKKKEDEARQKAEAASAEPVEAETETAVA